MKINNYKTTNKSSNETKRIYPKSRRKARAINSKTETRYRILENTMRGYFNYSI